METENRKLTKQVKDMMKFLSDYGLTWVGDGPNPESLVGEAASLSAEDEVSKSEDTADIEDKSDLWLPDKAVAKAPKPKPSGAANLPHEMEFDMKVLQARIAELNIVAGEGKCDVAKNKKGEFKLAKREYVELGFWKNGFQLNGCPLRSYTVKMNRSFVQDILDGYFPYELKDKYPDGVPFTVLDRTFEKYHRPFSQAGQGRALGVQPGSKIGKSLTDVTAPDVKTSASQQEVDADAFIAKLPKNVIRNGKIVPVRSGVEDMIKGSKEVAPPDVQSNIVRVNATAETSFGVADTQSAVINKDEKTSTLQIRSAESGKTFIMKFPYSTTVTQVLDRLIQEADIVSDSDYQLQTTFPKKTIEETNVTLEEAGLVPNCALILVQKQ